MLMSNSLRLDSIPLGLLPRCCLPCLVATIVVVVVLELDQVSFFKLSYSNPDMEVAATEKGFTVCAYGCLRNQSRASLGMRIRNVSRNSFKKSTPLECATPRNDHLALVLRNFSILPKKNLLLSPRILDGLMAVFRSSTLSQNLESPPRYFLSPFHRHKAYSRSKSLRYS